MTNTLNLKTEQIPFTDADLEEMQEDHFRFHTEVLGTNSDVAKKIAQASIEPLKDDMNNWKKEHNID